MPAGAVLDLVAKGGQDVYLTDKPDITLFKMQYRRYANFAVEAVQNTFNGNPDFGKRVQMTIARVGDLANQAYLVTTLPAVTAAGSGASWVREVGHQLVKSVEFDVGGTTIDKHYAEWMTIWSSLTLRPGQAAGYANMIGNISTLTAAAGASHVASAGQTIPAKLLHIPLQFSWNRYAGMALPLVALSQHESKLTVEFRTFAELIRGAVTAVPNLGDTSIWIDYVYLQESERQKFAMFPHEYLFEQLQALQDESVPGTSSKIRLVLNHPVKELYWFIRRDDAVDTSNRDHDWTNFTTVTSGITGVNPIESAQLLLSGTPRFAERPGDYFRFVQPYQYHTNTPLEGLNCYSFAEHPEEYAPSGSCNFSKFDNVTLSLKLVSAMVGVACTCSVYALGYNVFRAISGLGGIGFAA